jgi:hypothetical protein
MTSYVDYTYYTNTYLGTSIPSADFTRLALRASAVIDQITFNRTAAIVTAGTDLTTIDAIQMATCAVAEEYQTVEDSGSADGIVSESVGSHSVTYAASSRQRRTATSRYADAAKLYLGSTGLMYRGFADGEYGSSLDEDE